MVAEGVALIQNVLKVPRELLAFAQHMVAECDAQFWDVPGAPRELLAFAQHMVAEGDRGSRWSESP